MAHGSDGARVSIVETGKHESRFDIQDPPPAIHRILTAIAKECKSPVYRKHGAFTDSKALRGIVADSSDSKGEADDIVRFLKKFGCLVENQAGWAFSAEGADRLIELICDQHPHIPRPNKDFAEMFERVSDPGPVPIVETPQIAAVSPIVEMEITEVFTYPETEYDDGMLEEVERDIRSERDKVDRVYRAESEMLEAEYRARRERLDTEHAKHCDLSDRQLKAVEDEQIARIKKRIADGEVEAQLHRQELERIEREKTERLAALERRTAARTD